MQLFFSPLSPYARKVMIVAHELGCADRIEKVGASAHPVHRDAALIAHNPLGQLPALLLDDGTMLADSRVICEYLDTQFEGAIFPRTGAARWQALADQSLGDGMLAGALLARYETAARPADKQWSDWLDGQLDKSRTGLAAIEQGIARYRDRFDIGTITIACSLSYLDLRFADFDWRALFPAIAAWAADFEKRPSLVETRLGGGQNPLR